MQKSDVCASGHCGVSRFDSTPDQAGRHLTCAAGGFKETRATYLAGRAKVMAHPRQMVANMSMEMNTI